MEPIIISAVAELKANKELNKAIASDLNKSDPSELEALKILKEYQISFVDGVSKKEK